MRLLQALHAVTITKSYISNFFLMCLAVFCWGLHGSVITEHLINPIPCNKQMCLPDSQGLAFQIMRREIEG